MLLRGISGNWAQEKMVKFGTVYKQEHDSLLLQCAVFRAENHLCCSNSKTKAEEVKGSKSQQRPQQGNPQLTPPQIRADPHHNLTPKQACQTQTVIATKEHDTALGFAHTDSDHNNGM